MSSLLDLLAVHDVDRLIYLSSTRLYRRAPDPASPAVLVDPTLLDCLYDATKAAGEALSLSSGVPAHVARVSNVYGIQPTSEHFLSIVLRSALSGRLELTSALESRRDFVRIDDAVQALLLIADAGTDRVYDVASGQLISTAEIVESLHRVLEFEVAVDPLAPVVNCPELAVSPLQSLGPYAPRRLLDDIDWLVSGYR